MGDLRLRMDIKIRYLLMFINPFSGGEITREGGSGEY